MTIPAERLRAAGYDYNDGGSSAMKLLDHFRPPLAVRRHWHSFHNAWSTYLASHLNDLLPQGYFAEPNVQFGVEIDVATFEEGNGSGSWQATWEVPAPTQ